MIKKYSKIFLFIVFCCVLFGCASSNSPQNAAKKTDKCSSSALIKQLKNHGANVIVLGDQVMIVLCSDSLFRGRTSVIRDSAHPTLDLVAKLINSYTSASIKIAAYTNDFGSTRINCAVSEEQAGSVERYLWRRGVNTRMMYAVGMGGANPVAKITGDWNNGQNYRVEITLEKLPLG